METDSQQLDSQGVDFLDTSDFGAPFPAMLEASPIGGGLAALR